MKQTRYSTVAATRPDSSGRRARYVAGFLFFWMALVGVRLVQLQTAQHEFLSAKARAQQQRTGEAAPGRGLILDRAGRELAASVEVDSFFAVPREVEDVVTTARQLGGALGVDAGQIETKLRRARESGRHFVWLARKVDAEASRRVRELNLQGVHARAESQRRYPNGSLAAHVLGFVGLDEEGLGGVEQFQNASLVGEPGQVTTEGDARRKLYDSLEVRPRDGQSVVLTIDQTVQYFAEQAISEAVARSRAKSGAAIVLDPRTGEILALANAPTFDPNVATKIAAEARVNQALQNIYEPGSTFKAVTYAAALEEKLARVDETIDCQMGSITLAGRVVRDHTPYGSLTLTEAMAKSSNVAAIKLGLRVGDARMHDYIRRFGFGQRTGVELPGETAGLLRPVARWQASSMGSIAIGQEIGVTPLQVASAFGALANDGVRVAPRLVREVRNADGTVAARTEAESRRVVSVETARAVRGMLEAVTVKGTAKRAQIEGYSAAGKTGTAQKIDPKTRAYSKTKHVASFVGFAPVENPAVVIIVVVDEPVGAYHGGDTAAPIFREIAERVLPYLNVMPDLTLEDAPGEATRLIAQDVPRQSGPTREALNEVAPPVVRLPEVTAARGAQGEVVFAEAEHRALLMPDLRGRSVRDAMRVCTQLGLELEALGEGRALRQSPAAGAAVEAGRVVRVEFGRSD